MTNFKKIGVVGSGTMGHGIAQTFATYGYETVNYDSFPEALKKAEVLVETNLKNMQKNGFISFGEAHACKKNLKFSGNIEDLKGCDLVVEAVPEKPEIKGPVYAQVAAVCGPETIIASTTSGFPIYKIVEELVKNKQLDHPERVIITHFNNPSHIIPLVEIVKGPVTQDALVKDMRELMTSIGKTPVVINQYIPGFIVNRLTAALLREASYLVEKGWVSAEDVDAAFASNQGLKAPFEGPLELMDYIGWDVAAGVGQVIYPFLNNATTPSPLAMQMLNAKNLGIKSGKGLYHDYTGIPREVLQARRDEAVMNILKTKKNIKPVSALKK